MIGSQVLKRKCLVWYSSFHKHIHIDFYIFQIIWKWNWIYYYIVSDILIIALFSWISMDCIQYICFRYSEKILLLINCIFVSDILKMASVLLLHSVFANKDFKRIFVTLLVELPVYVLSIIVTFFSIQILLCNVHQCDPFFPLINVM